MLHKFYSSVYTVFNSPVYKLRGLLNECFVCLNTTRPFLCQAGFTPRLFLFHSDSADMFKSQRSVFWSEMWT